MGFVFCHVLEAHVEKALLPERFCLRAKHDLVGKCELGRFISAGAQRRIREPPSFTRRL